MASYYGKDLADVALAYHRKFIHGKSVVDLSHNFRNYTVHEDFASPTYFDPGEKTFNYMLQVGAYSNYQLDALNNPESYTTGNLLIQASAYWAMIKDGWMVDSRQPGFKKNASPSEIVSIFDAHRRNLWNSIYQNEEIYKWTLAAAPNDGTAGKIRPRGIPNYLVKASSSTPGVVTSHPSGYTTVDGVSRSTYPQAGNYGSTYTANDMVDLDDKMNKLFDLMQWTPPKMIGSTVDATNDYCLETTRDVYWLYKKFLRTMNSDIGPDAGKYYGSVGAENVVYFRNVPMYHVDALSSTTLRNGDANPAVDSTNVVYMRDKSTWKLIAGKGEFMREDPPHSKDNPKNMVSFDVFSMHGRVCDNPSRNAVLST